MQNVQSEIMCYRGSHYDLGIHTAKWLKQTDLLKNREKEWKKRIPRFDILFFKRMHLKFGKNSWVCKMY